MIRIRIPDPRINGIFRDPLIVSFPYYSHTTPIRIPKDMVIVWEACHKGVPLLGVPGITLDRVFAKFLVLRLLGGKGDLKKDHSHHLFCHKSKMLWEKLQVSQQRIEKKKQASWATEISIPSCHSHRINGHGIFTYICCIFIVHVGKYTIH